MKKMKRFMCFLLIIMILIPNTTAYAINKKYSLNSEIADIENYKINSGELFDKEFFEKTIHYSNIGKVKGMSLKLDIPHEYKLIMDYDFEDEFEQYDCGCIFVINQNNEIIYTIEPPKLLFKNKSLDSDYKVMVSGKELNICSIKDSLYCDEIVLKAKSVIYKKSSKNFINNPKTRQNLDIMLKDIQSQQHNTSPSGLTIISLAISLLSIPPFDVVISALHESDEIFINKEERFYSQLVSAFGAGVQINDRWRDVISVNVHMNAKGVYRGKQVGYVYSAMNTTRDDYVLA